MKNTVSSYLLDHLLEIRADFPESPETNYSLPFMDLLGSADRDQLNQSFTEKRFSKGEIVFNEGDEGETIFLVWSGQVAIVKGDLASPTILDFRGAGEIFGEMAILENQPRSATIIALEDTRLLGLNRTHFEQLLQTTPEVSRSIMEVLSARLRRTSDTRNLDEISEQRLFQQVTALQSEKQHLEEIQRLRQETTELIVHDLRNPLSTIAITLKMLTLVLPEQIRLANDELLRILQESTLRMQRLVETLLEVSRMESGETRFEMSAFDLPSLIEEQIKRISILAGNSVSFQLNVPPGLPLVYADQEKIERVLVNLIDNSLKYMSEPGRIQITIQTVGSDLQISVSDNGPGIPPADRERIFDRFTQRDDGKPSRRGFGLGLAYCRLAVEGHGGRIWVEDGEAGNGSRFVFTLPLKNLPNT